jgi:hypothetical protein
MHRKIIYEQDYQQIAIIFNTKLNIIQTATYLNKLISCELSLTGELESYDLDSENFFKFSTLSFEDETSKTTMFLIKNRGTSTLNQPTGSLFSDETTELQKYLLGNRNSIYTHKNLINTDYCFMLSFPPGQKKPAALISKLKTSDKIQTSIEVNIKSFKFCDDLTSEIEEHLNKHNKENSQSDLAIDRRRLLQKNANPVKSVQPASNRIFFPNIQGK